MTLEGLELKVPLPQSPERDTTMLTLRILRERLIQREPSLVAKAEPGHLLPGPRLHTLLGFSFIPDFHPGKHGRLGKEREKAAYQEVDGLNDVQKHFILPILDAF